MTLKIFLGSLSLWIVKYKRKENNFVTSNVQVWSIIKSLPEVSAMKDPRKDQTSQICDHTHNTSMYSWADQQTCLKSKLSLNLNILFKFLFIYLQHVPRLCFTSILQIVLTLFLRKYLFNLRVIDHSLDQHDFGFMQVELVPSRATYSQDWPLREVERKFQNV